jgi:hypothetical protein
VEVVGLGLLGSTVTMALAAARHLYYIFCFVFMLVSIFDFILITKPSAWQT